MYHTAVKKHKRRRVITHAVKCLTTDRSNSVCVKRDHVRRLWQQLRETEEGQISFSKDVQKNIEEEITKWELLHDSRVQTKQASDLRVCYLCGENPMNDLQVFLENGILRQNVWGIEKDGKELKKVRENIVKSNSETPHIFEGNLLNFLKDKAGQYDIIYFDATGSLPSNNQQTLKVIGQIFLHDKLASPGALITNFSFPPEQKEPLNEQHEIETKSLEYFAKEFLHYRLCNTKIRENYGSFKELREAKIDSRSSEENYGDYVTYHVIDSAYLYIPAYRMLSSGQRSLWDQMFVDRREKFLNVVKGDDKNAFNDESLHRLVTTIEADCKDGTPKNYKDLCKTWVKEIFPDWQQSQFQKDELSCLTLTHSLSHNPAFFWEFAKEDLKERCEKAFENFSMFPLCDSNTNTSENFISLLAWVLYHQLATPSFPVIDKCLRFKYTAEKRQMFADVFIFDQCRYVFEQVPCINPDMAINDLPQQMVFRIVADGLRKHLSFLFNDVFRSLKVTVTQIPGGTKLLGHHFNIPEREVLDFAFFKELGHGLFCEGSFMAAMECFDVCQELCPNNVTFYIINACCAFMIGEHDKYVANFKKAQELVPDIFCPTKLLQALRKSQQISSISFNNS